MKEEDLKLSTRIKHTFGFIIFFLLSFSLKAQIGDGSSPSSFKSANLLKSSLSAVFIPPPEIKQLQAEDRVNDSLGKPYRIAYMVPVDLCANYTGKWDSLSTGEIIWRLKITSPGASGLQLVYDNFHLPQGSKLFLYSEDKKFLIGAFTEKNNHSSRQFATEIIPGETAVLEYVQGNNNEKPTICISKVGYVYRGMDIFSSRLKSLKQAGPCEVDVHCSPEGDNWTDVKRAVGKIIIGGYVCSGTLLNNTAQDYRNLFCTAFHCIDGQENLAGQYIVYFDYEHTSCNNTQIANYHTVSGAIIRAAIPLKKGSDGVILELNGTIPDSYNVFWAGWDRNEIEIAGGACIHHPKGDVKKISTSRSRWTTNTWYGIDTVVGAKGAHWGVIFSETQNGYGVTESGSSGSGLFGPDELFRGQLSGGSSTCAEPTGDNLYGKLSYSWDKFGSADNLQFKKWLDPLNTGIKRLKGIDKHTQAGIYWTSTSPVIDIDSTVHYTDESVYHPSSWNWTFEGGTPYSSNLSNPSVQYTSPGLYDVSLTITNDNGTLSKTRSNYVYVKPRPAWVVQNSRFRQTARGIKGFSIVDSLIVWAWAYDGLSPNTPIMEYTYTTDGGNHWKSDSIGNPDLKGFGMSNLFAISKDTVYAAISGPNGGGKIIRTVDAGITWQVQSSATFTGTDGFPNFVCFFNHHEGVCVGDPNNGYYEIYTTTDGGNNWTRIPSTHIPANLSGETGTVNMYYAQGDTLWFGASNGRVYRSTDKGRNWTFSVTGLTGRTNVRFRNAKVGFAIQQKDGTTPFAMKKTFNGGTTWQAYSIPVNCKQGDLTYVPGTPSSWVNVSSVHSSSGSSYSIDDGTSFTSIDSDIQYTSVDFYNSHIGWAGAYNPDSVSGGIYKWVKTNSALTNINNNVSPNPINGKQLFVVQPNPIKGIMVVSSQTAVSDNVKISIVNASGILLEHFTFNHNTGVFRQSFDLSSYSPGIYVVIIQTKDETEIQKIIIQ